MVYIPNEKDSAYLLDKLWRNITPKKRKQLLKAYDLDSSWSKTESMNEMVKRGGGMVANRLLRGARLWRQRNPDTNVIFK